MSLLKAIFDGFRTGEIRSAEDMLEYAKNISRVHSLSNTKTQTRQAVSPRAQRCALLEGCILRFALRPSIDVLEYLAPIQSVLGACNTLTVGVQVFHNFNLTDKIDLFNREKWRVTGENGG